MGADHVADELAIRNLVARYADAATCRDEAGWADTWADDGAWQILGQTAKGRDAVVELWRQLVAGFERVVQHPASGSIEVDGDEASGRWAVSEQGRTLDGNAMLTLGTYEDRYRREAGHWRFAERRFQAHYFGPPDLSGNFMPVPGGNGEGSR